MKKILILAAVIVAGITANAASFKWSAGNIYASNGTDKYVGTVDLYAYLSTADASTAIKVSTVTSSSAGAVAATTFDVASFTAGNSYTFFFIVEDNGKVFTSTEKTVAAFDTQTQNITFGNMTTATQNAANWATAAAPEPTSGLLMLVGLAGLALRRRRA